MSRIVRRTRPVVAEVQETCILGIDPGNSGALAVLTEDGDYVDSMIIPIVASGKSNRVNGAAVAAFLAQYNIVHAYIEKVGAMPGNGGTSMFTFGHSAGKVEGIVEGRMIPVTHLTPQSWKKAGNLVNKPKDCARSRCVQLYPHVRILDTKIRGGAVGDAILIARAGHGLSM